MEPWKRTLYICALGVFLSSLGLSQVAPILPLYFHQLGIPSLAETATWSGLAMGITFIVVALVSPLWGRLADRKGRKLMLLRASFGMMITNLMAAAVTGPEQLVIVRALQGLVSGFYPASITLVVTQVPKEKTGESLGLLSAMAMGGSLLGPIIGGYIATVLGIRYLFFIIAALLLLIFFLISTMVHEEFTPVEEGTRQTLSYLKQHIEHWPLIVTMAIATFIYSIATLILQPIMTIYVEHLLPKDSMSQLAFLSGLVFSLAGVAQMISSSPFGRFVDRVGSHKVIIIALLYVGLTTIPQVYVTNIYQLIILRFLMGLGLGGLMPAINTFISTHCPQRFTGQVFSYTQSAQYLGFFLGSYGGSVLLDMTNFTTVFWMTGMLFIITAGWIYYAIGFRHKVPEL